MSTRVYYVPSINVMGKGCLQEIAPYIQELNLKKALVVTDKFLMKSGIAGKLLSVLDAAGIEYVVYDEVKPNPTCKNVHDGVDFLKSHECDYLISIGGGSPQDTAKAIGIVATNGGHIAEYEGVHKSKNKSLPIVAVNTTAGTSSEVTINYVITDEERKVKMVMVDKNSIATISVNDPELMVDKPAALTAATGMDALTHAIEALVTPGAYPVTDATALAAVELIFGNLAKTVKNGHDIEAREQMVYAIFLGGLAFNNAGLGYVHAMAHQLGGVYDLPHGVCNAMLLPYVEEENAKYVPEKFRAIAKAIGLQVEGKTDKECADFVIESIKELSKEVGIPAKLSDLGVDEVDLDLLAENAMKDACAPGNPFIPTKEEVIALFRKIL
ncbi:MULTISPECIES: iron-containing alcohol dehydrogenase [unclassified Paenibacillus]|uniref:iron-containing alcohol dehydrogenase n=1 Tax=unclassified Paenibacillus TaxID=185978 RepID=UPI0024059CB7|nr:MULTISPECIES: iron-containing alcohol dehydrogenase [unclassified Paenibacillus]MDF9840989.1 alcohol dehydrogenase [Paenibacillus sp. PastF-2]MDF9847839.1 alcohol dehydrogenase [Paenibacillus sp. PastM-2]MDF9854407.1 alcohol dehydrogenase [Paenibacillus sp. PastF-1]MDH6479422.1 alcohol dehydrogenase [Paenibacillus sp. PastH-2]MDH6505088.1 alcohol dehydrogenase [Paenibacillus sp. PastM-3]